MDEIHRRIGIASGDLRNAECPHIVHLSTLAGCGKTIFAPVELDERTFAVIADEPTGCSKRLSSAAAASEEARAYPCGTSSP